MDYERESEILLSTLSCLGGVYTLLVDGILLLFGLCLEDRSLYLSVDMPSDFYDEELSLSDTCFFFLIFFFGLLSDLTLNLGTCLTLTDY